MIEIKYDQPIEVSADQYHVIMRKLPGVCAGRYEDGSYFIKVWLMKYVDQIQKIIK